MPINQEKNYLMKAQEDLSKWLEARPIVSKNDEIITKFLYEDIIC